MIDIPKMTAELKRDEGFRGCAYRCTANKITIGYGHNIQDKPMPEFIAEKLLQSDIIDAVEECERFDWFHSLSDVRQRVIINMVFNMGAHGVSKFKKMIASIRNDEWHTASREMLDSKWANQVGDRAIRLSQMMRNDTV